MAEYIEREAAQEDACNRCGQQGHCNRPELCPKAMWAALRAENTELKRDLKKDGFPVVDRWEYKYDAQGRVVKKWKVYAIRKEAAA